MLICFRLTKDKANSDARFKVQVLLKTHAVDIEADEQVLGFGRTYIMEKTKSIETLKLLQLNVMNKYIQ